MEWTSEQQAVIDSRGCNLLVSAAAGSGKTAVLVERIVQIIKRGEADLSSLLIVTFTNAAAQEMRERILKANPDQYRHLSNANISTFHAFALEVIKRYFHLIDLAPGFQICDEARQVILQEEAMDELIREGFEADDAGLLMLMDWYATARSDEGVRKLIRDTWIFIQSLPRPFEWLETAVAELETDSAGFKTGRVMTEIRRSIEEQLTRAETAARQVGGFLDQAGLPFLLQKTQADLQRIQAVQAAFAESFEEGVNLLQATKGYAWERFVAKAEEKAGYAEIRESIASLREYYKAVLKDIEKSFACRDSEDFAADAARTGPAVRALLEWVRRFDERYSEKKRGLKLLDFSDIEHFALRILEHETAAAEYRSKFKYIFIDEYQDSNLVQETLIRRIAKDNNVFMVGDVKQSIYKFRLAEPEIFLSKYAAFAADSGGLNQKIDLNRNFRSKAGVIKAVNQVFDQAMTPANSGIDYAVDGQLTQGLPDIENYTYPAALHLLDSELPDDADLEDELRSLKQLDAEAGLAAGLIRRHHGKLIYDHKKKTVRPLEYRDMVILLRSAVNTAEAYYNALRNQGIPCYMDAGDGYFDTLEISVFLNLLRLIDNRRQDIPLISVLRSPIFNFSTAELTKIRIAAKRIPYHQALESYAAQGEDALLSARCVAVLERLDRWCVRSAGLPLEDFFWQLLQESAYYLYVGSLPAGSQRQANLRALLDRAATYEAARSGGLSGFLNYIEAVMKGKIAVPPVKLISESDDVVRIMTIHKSKGLEFPFVLVGNLGKAFRGNNEGSALLHRDIGVGLKLVDCDSGVTRRTLVMKAIADRKLKEDLAEEIRILYVAMTRAQDYLLLLGSMKDPPEAIRKAKLHRDIDIQSARCLLNFLLPEAGSENLPVSCHDRRTLLSPDYNGGDYADGRDATSTDAGPACPDSDGDAAVRQEVFRRLDWQYPHLSSTLLKSKYSVTGLTKPVYERPDQDYSADAPQSRQSAEEAAARGTIYHQVMELFPFDRPDISFEQVEVFLHSLVTKEILKAEEAARVDPRDIWRFAASELGREIGRADRLWRELPFNIEHEIDGETVLVQGIIDCCYRLDGRYTLIDFKTNRINGSDDADRLFLFYRAQLESYKIAIEKLKRIKIERACLVFLDSGDVRELSS